MSKSLDVPSPDVAYAVDVLRGVVILLVLYSSYGACSQSDVLGHASGLGLPSLGFLALQLFLAIAAYRLVGEMETHRHVGDYVSARVLRYLPALWPAVAICAVVGLAAPEDLQMPASAIPANLLMAADLLDIPVLDASFWRLKLELLMSVGVGLISFGFGRRIPPMLVLAALALAGYSAHGADPAHSHTLSLVGALTIDGYLGPCAFGMALYRLVHASEKFAWGAVALASLGSIVMLNTPSHSVVVLAAMAILTLAAVGWLTLPRFIGPLAWLGNLSFAIYVVHQTPGLILIGRLESAGVDPATAVAVTSLAAIGMGMVVHYGFELPLRKELPLLTARVARALEPRALIARMGSMG